jgi:hypothetical protein
LEAAPVPLSFLGKRALSNEQAFLGNQPLSVPSHTLNTLPASDLPTGSPQTPATPSYYIPDRTCPRKPLKKNGTEQKDYEWVAQVEGVPCRIVAVEETAVLLHSFAADVDTVVRVPRAEFDAQFTPAKQEGDVLFGVKYPGGTLHISEFDKRKEALELLAQVLKVVTDKSLRDKLDQVTKSQGSTKAATVAEYLDYKAGTRVLGPTENLGDPIFNRSKRWCPPVDIDHDTFKQSKGFPAPLGIRPKDFCLPSALIQGVLELVVQMASFENAPAPLVAFVSAIPGVTLPGRTHRCKWCGETVDAAQCISEYKSSTNYIEICHRDPNGMFSPENMYWGHGDCNRRQGGYTEKDRIEDAIRLLLENPDYRREFAGRIQLVGNSA